MALFISKARIVSGAGWRTSSPAANADLLPRERISAFNRNMSETGWISKDLPDMADRFDRRWLIADYEVPATLCCTVPTPSMRQRPMSIRTALCGCRRTFCYQPVAEEIDARWSNHWSPDDGL